MTKKDREPDDPLLDELRKLASEHGDIELLRACLTVVQRYAEQGARQALTKRAGDGSIQCPRCRERDAMAKQLEVTLKRVTTGRAIGGSVPNTEED